MKRKITIREFEALLTTRILSKRMTTSATNGKMREKIDYGEFLDLAVIEAAKLLRDVRLNKSLRIHRSQRAERAFLGNQNQQKIACELGVVFDKKQSGKITQPKVVLISKYKMPKFVEDLA